MSDTTVTPNTKTSEPGKQPVEEAPSISADLPEAKPRFPIVFKAMSEDNAAIAEENWELMREAANKLAAMAQESCSATVKESLDYSLHIIESARTNYSAAVELAKTLMAAKAQAEVIEASAAHARRQLNLLVDQNRRLWATAQKITRGLLEPVARNGS